MGVAILSKRFMDVEVGHGFRVRIDIDMNNITHRDGYYLVRLAGTGFPYGRENFCSAELVCGQLLFDSARQSSSGRDLYCGSTGSTINTDNTAQRQLCTAAAGWPLSIESGGPKT